MVVLKGNTKWSFMKRNSELAIVLNLSSFVTRISAFLVLVVAVSSCGGGSDEGLLSGDAGTIVPSGDELLTWQPGVFFDKAAYQAMCAEPRTGPNPFDDNRPFPDELGSVSHENFYLRSWTNDLYFWYDEVEDQDPNLFTTAEYFDELKTMERTPSNRLKDNFHFSENTANYLTRTVSGETFGYGMNLVFASVNVPRLLIVRDVVPGSPAAVAGVERGMEIITIDGEDLVSGGDVDALNNGLYPPALEEDHTFDFLPVGSNTAVELTLTSANIESVPVKAVTTIDTASGGVGYIHFNSHIRPAERDLYDAFTSLQGSGVSDLILDLRYNGGGLLAIAGQVGYMVAGSQSNGDTFYRLAFNDKQSSGSPIPFHSESLGFSEDLNAGLNLPTLNLSTVYILTTGGTCSASEAIINGLMGVDVDVVLIGDTTCGKPYGFFPQDNCGTTYFTVQFAGVNANNFGEYPDGFSPSNMPSAPGVSVPGCRVEDDFEHLLGDPEEALLAAALQYREDGSCPALPSSSKALVKSSQKSKVETSSALRLPREYPGLNNAIIQL